MLERTSRPVTAEIGEKQEFIKKAIKDLRDRLIDISKRNPLISFKHSERSASYLRVIDERPDALFQRLRNGEMRFEPLPDPQVEPADEKTSDFRMALQAARLTDARYLHAMDALGESAQDEEKAAEIEQELRAAVRKSLGLPPLAMAGKLNIKEYARAHGINPSFELSARLGDPSPHLSDDLIRVLHVKERLEARLRIIHDKYRSFEAETSIHTLHAAFGFLEWAEDGASKTIHHAPLLLMRTHISRGLVRNRYTYRLSGHDEDLEVNIALREFLRRQFRFELPAIADGDTPESFFVKTGPLLADIKCLSGIRRYVTIGIFPFPRMVLWADLDAERWPGNKLLTHDQVALLLGGREPDSASTSSSCDYDIEADFPKQGVPPLIMPADISQHSALIEVAAGRSVAIEGPPGTGKSQTIANMIAAALDRGQRILFLAEKRAALDVVADRLNKSGFEPLMLPLYSDQAIKDEVMKSLRVRMSAAVSEPGLVLTRIHKDLKQQRNSLRHYISLLRHQVGALEWPVNALYWRFLSLHARLAHLVPTSLNHSEIHDAENISAFDLKEKRAALDALEKTAAQIRHKYGTVVKSPWHAATNLRPIAFQHSELRQLLNAVVITIDRMQEVIEEVERATGTNVPASAGDVATLLLALTRLPADAADVCQARLRTALQASEAMQRLIPRLQHYRDCLAQAHLIHPAPLTADLDAFGILDLALRPLACPSLTTAALQRRRHEAFNWGKDVHRLDAYLRPVCAKLGIDADTTSAYALRVLTAVLKHLREAPVEILQLRAACLLGGDAAPRLGAGEAAAIDLRKREAVLTERINLDAASGLGPEALDQLASILWEAGLVSRIVSSRYRASCRSIRAMCKCKSIDREAVVVLLRTTAQWLRDAEKFRENTTLSQMFGGAWQGHTSDFSKLELARTLLVKLTTLLLPVGMNDFIQFIAAAPTLAVQAIAGEGQLDDRAEQALARIEANLTLPQVLAAGEHHEKQLDSALAAAAAAGVLSNGEFRLLEPSTTDLFRELHALHCELSAFPNATELWGWYEGPEEDPEKLASVLSMADAIVAANLPRELMEQVAAAAEPGVLVAGLRTSERTLRSKLQAVWNAWDAFCTNAGTDAATFLKVSDSAAVRWADARRILIDAHSDTEGLKWFADLQKFLTNAEERQVRFIYDAFIAADQPIHDLADIFELMLIETLLRHFLETDGNALLRFGGVSLEQARQHLRKLDVEAMALEGRRIIAQRLAQKPSQGVGWGPKSALTELALIKNELSKQKRHIPIRDLVNRAANALQTLKPVWLMSPMSVAQYVPPGSAEFDLVIIDEASQMRPEYAIGAIARAEQVVIVGDPKQLPPTDFFAVRQQDSDEDAGVAGDSKSILDLALAQLSNTRRLKWHYRSRHPSLITFSNRWFYNRDLVVFPIARTDDPILGVKYTYVAGGNYSNSINSVEAKAVVERALALVYSNPDLSLGIVTMNIEQRHLIFSEIERYTEEDVRLREYRERHAATAEPFIVKNLENIQGDERDIILISTCYGPAPGATGVKQLFGPINSENGHRRLNVLFTRAKMATELFSSLRPTDVVVGPNSREGVRAFRAYLEYAAGGAVVDAAEGGDPDSDFEEFVAERLRAAGYEVIPQVGVERFRIDLGVRHPSYPLGFLAGVECDGATYHAALTIRDRDCIRQDILEGLGWRIYRIWSTDWFNDPERETDHLLRWLEEHRAREALRYESRRNAIAEAEAAERSDGSAASLPLPLPAAKKSQLQIAAAARRDSAAATATALAGSSDIGRSSASSEFNAIKEQSTLAANVETKTVLSAPQARPEGRKRSIDGIDYYEVQPGYWEVWIDGRLTGDIQSLSRTPVRPARLYGGHVVAPITHYQVTMTGTNEVFNTDDIYEAVRSIAKRSDSL